MDINLGFAGVATGTVDVIEATFSPAPTLADKKILFLRCSGANTVQGVTFNPNSLGAKTIVKQGSVALQVGDIPASNFVAILQYNLANEEWELLNPKGLLDLTGVSGVYVNPSHTIKTALQTLDGILFSAVLGLASKQETLVNETNIKSIDGVTLLGSGELKSKTEIQLACSDETTAIDATNGKITFRMPYAMTVADVRASLTTAQASGNTFTVDINEGGTTILSTKITIDNTEKTSTTAATAPVISDSSLADDAEITVDVDQIGDGTATGLKVTLIGTRA